MYNIHAQIDTACTCFYLQENVGLKTLNVSFNGFGHEGTCAMAQALAHNTTLHDLDMSKNRITDIGVIMLTKQLKHNEGLRILRVSTVDILNIISLCWYKYGPRQTKMCLREFVTS